MPILLLNGSHIQLWAKVRSDWILPFEDFAGFDLEYLVEIYLQVLLTARLSLKCCQAVPFKLNPPLFKLGLRLIILKYLPSSLYLSRTAYPCTLDSLMTICPTGHFSTCNTIRSRFETRSQKIRTYHPWKAGSSSLWRQYRRYQPQQKLTS